MSNTIQSEKAPSVRSLVAPTLFGQLPEDARVRLLDNAPLRLFAHGQIIQQRGERPNGFWVIESGSVKIGQFRLNGEFRTLALLGDGDSYGELAVLAGSDRAVESVADGAVSLRWIETRAFERAIDGNSAAMRQLIGALALELQEVLSLAASLGQGNSIARIASTLANLARDGAAGTMLKLGQQELGELTGLTRVTINKCLADLERQGAIRRHYARIEICNLDHLKEISAN